ncbi:MAG: hypothetical protein MRECE_2c016 [Mycoplasmataceae bacterium CE_OT135]|nr:MAG: hypothetical protein MRECE_2c016 [Mycoplasmataceae bacterium CE_OT135]
MSLFPDITPLTNKITEFTSTQQHSQAQIIALLKQNNLLLAQILQNQK